MIEAGVPVSNDTALQFVQLTRGDLQAKTIQLGIDCYHSPPFPKGHLHSFQIESSHFSFHVLIGNEFNNRLHKLG
jgi:hypothetical protein